MRLDSDRCRLLTMAGLLVALVLVENQRWLGKIYVNVASVQLAHALDYSAISPVPVALANRATDWKWLEDVYGAAVSLSSDACGVTRGLAVANMAQYRADRSIALWNSDHACVDARLAQFELGSAYWSMGQRANALTAWRRAQADEYFCHLGQALVNQRAFELGLRWLTTAIEINPENENAYLSMAVAYKSMGQEEDAISVLEQSLNLLPQSTALHIALADILLYGSKRCVGCALDEYRQAYMNGGEIDRDAQIHFAQALFWSQDSKEALAVLGRLPPVSHPDNQAYDLYAEIYLYLDNLELAQSYAQKSIQTNPDSPWVWYLSGLIMDRLGKPAEAQAAFEKLKRLKPELAEELARYINLAK